MVPRNTIIIALDGTDAIFINVSTNVIVIFFPPPSLAFLPLTLSVDPFPSLHGDRSGLLGYKRHNNAQQHRNALKKIF